MTNSVIGALSVEITADTEGVKKGLKSTGDALKLSSKQLRSNANKWGKWALSATAAATAVAAAIVKSNLTQIRELKNSAQAANVSVEAFERGAFAAEQFGISQEKYGDILKDTNDRVGDFLTTGAGPMVDFFETIAPKVGITAEAFKGLSGEQSLGLYIKSLQEAGVSQQEMTFFMEALASDSTRLTPLFEDNAKVFNELTKEAKDLGIGLSKIDVAKAEMASTAIAKAGGLVDSMAKQFTVEMAPIVQALADAFVDMAKEAGGSSAFIKKGIDKVIDVIGIFANGLRGVEIIFKGLEIAALGFAALGANVFAGFTNLVAGVVDTVNSGINSIIKASNKFLKTDFMVLPAMKDSKFIKSVNKVADSMIATIGVATKELDALLLKPLPSEEIKVFVDEAVTNYERLAIAKVKALGNKEEGDGVGTKTTSEIGIFEAETIGILEAMGLRFQSQEEMELAHLERQRLMNDEARANGQLTEIQYQEALSDIKQKEEDVRRQMTMQNIQQGFQALAQNSKKVQKLMQVAAITQAVIKGKDAAVSAWSAGMSVGGPYAPLVAAAYTAASIANTASMISSIRSSGKSAPKPSAGGAGAALSQANSGGQSQNSGSAQSQPNQSIDINIVGEGLLSTDQVRALLGQINTQLGDGMTLNIGD